MNYFTRERYLALQQIDEAAMAAADADWESEAERYDAYLQTIRPAMSEDVRQLLDGFYLQGAHVLSMGQRGDTFVIAPQMEPPPHELLTITYTLVGPPDIKQEPFSWAEEFTTVTWLYEEIELRRDGEQPYFVHAILFSNGWEVRLPFRAVQMTTTFPVLPLRRRPGPDAPSGSTSQPA